MYIHQSYTLHAGFMFADMQMGGPHEQASPSSEAEAVWRSQAQLHSYATSVHANKKN